MCWASLLSLCIGPYLRLFFRLLTGRHSLGGITGPGKGGAGQMPWCPLAVAGGR